MASSRRCSTAYKNICPNFSKTVSLIHSENNTICALATPTGGAIAVVRVSGPQCYPIVGKLLHEDIADALPNTLRHTRIYAPDSTTIDDVVLAFYRHPHSYTGEDAIEISCHGSRYVAQLLLNALIAAGCHQAEPGEYTRRAYLNGKMDLSQAEAVADLIASANRASHQLALSQLKGHVRTALEELRERLLKLTTLLELELDFSDHDDLTFADRSELLTLSQSILSHIARLASTYRMGKAIKEGIPVAIVGKTNVGKSTLLNRLLGEERALVSDIHGTTRDSIEDTTTIGGLTFRFIDTAGIRQTEDTVEKMGIDRTWDKLAQATIVLWVVDTLPGNDEIAQMRSRCEGKHLVIAHNKADLRKTTASLEASSVIAEGLTFHPISAKTGKGMDSLEAAILSAADIPEIHEADIIITSARQYDLLNQALEELRRVTEGLSSSLPTDLVAEDLRLVLNTLANITGIDRITPKSTLDNIFSSYCIGK